MVYVGAHVVGGIKGGPARGLELGAEALQIFIGSPQMWRAPNPASKDVDAFRAEVVDKSLGQVFVHCIYLVNLASQNPEVLEKSLVSLRVQLELANLIGAAGLVFHPGSAGKAPYEEAIVTVADGMRRVLDGYSGAARLVPEVCAGQGQTIGDRFEEFRDLFAMLDHDPRLGVCWDTCHLFNAGYDVSTGEGLERTVEEFDRLVGLERLVVVHANDSKNPLGSKLDRHENIGQGHIGEDGFARMLAHPALQALPWILEVPGYDNQGPDLLNVETMKRLAGRPVAAGAG
jgi:deoxyribonuclease IV